MPNSTLYIDHELSSWGRPTTLGGKKAWQKVISAGGDDTPEIVLVRYEPGYELPQHSRSEDRVIYVVQGEMLVKGRRCPPGTVMFVKKGSLCGPFKAQARGVQYVAIRPTEAG